MSTPDDSQRNAVAAAFLKRYLEDRDAGRTRPLNAYQALFPGFEEVIASEYHEVAGAPAPASDAASLARVAHYRLLRELGRGGQGAVYLAEDTRLGRNVALKALNGWSAASPELLDRFTREGLIAARLDHPGICPVYETGVADGLPFIAMRHVPGRSLGDIIKDGQDGKEGDPPRKRIVRILGLVEQAARAAHVAHEAGVLHRDLKPGNIMVTPEGEAVILDFGLALDVEAGHSSLTRTGDVFGTPHYMAPEQLATNPRRLDRRTDVYSLGVTLYEGLTGRRPFEATTRDGLYRAILQQALPDPRKRNGAIPADLKTVLETAVEKDPDRRYQTALDLAEDLRRVRKGEPVHARPIGPLRRVVRWVRREPVRAALLAAVLALVAVGGYLAAEWPRFQANQALIDAQARGEKLEHRLARAFAHLGDGHQAEAVRLFREALDIEPGSPEAVAGIGLALLRQERPREALAILQSAASMRERHPALRLVEADALEALGRKEESEALAASVGEPGNHLAFFLAGSRALESGHRGETAAFARARDLLTLCVETAPAPRRLYHFVLADAVSHGTDGDRARQLAAAIRAVWKDDAAAGYWRGVVLARVDPDRAVAAYREALRLAPEEGQAWYNLGRLLYKKPDLEGALDAFGRAARLLPGFVDARINLGGVLISRGEVEAGIRELRRALEERPDSPVALINLGSALTKQGKLDEAIATYRRLAARKPDYENVHERLGLALSARGDLSGAIESFRADCRYRKDRGQSYFNLGVALARSGDYKGAAEAYREAADRWPTRSAFFALGRALNRTGEPAEAEKAYRAALEIAPGERRIRVRLAQALVGQDRYAEAIALLREALGGRSALPSPEDFLAPFVLGRACFGLGDVDGAIAACRQALAIRAANPAALCNLGLGLQAKGRYREALRALKRGHALGQRDPFWKLPSGAWIADVERQLQLEPKLEPVLRGEVRPADADELAALARIAAAKERPAAAARLWSELFLAHPDRLGRWQGGEAVWAAEMAALAGGGRGEDAGTLDAQARAGWRERARRWLAAALDARRAAIAQGGDVPAHQRAVARWKSNPALRDVRDAEPLTRLPPAEREQWRSFWAAVDDFLRCPSR